MEVKAYLYAAENIKAKRQSAIEEYFDSISKGSINTSTPGLSYNTSGTLSISSSASPSPSSSSLSLSQNTAFQLLNVFCLIIPLFLFILL
jgi:hypothetical protein